MKIESIYTPQPKQLEAHKAALRFRHTLFGGSAGCGKSFWLCAEAARHATEYKGARVLLTRMQLSSFDRTTRVTMDTILGSLHYHIAKNGKSEIRFKNGSVIIMGMALDANRAIQKLSGLEISAFFFDQIEECPESVFRLLQSRLRSSVPGIWLQGCATANPHPGWVKERWYRHPGKDFHFVQALPGDNKYLGPDYLSHLRDALPEYMYEALALGSWEYITAQDALMSAEQIENAMSRKMTADGPLKVAVDPAFSGECSTVIATKRGPVVEIADVMSGRDDTTSIVERIGRVIGNDPSIVICVDEVGAGIGVVNGCQAKGWRVFPVNAQARAINPRFKNRRSENYFLLAQSIGAISLPHDKRLRDELMAMRALVIQGRTAVEGKADLAKRGISCDRADAVAMLFHEEPAMTWQYVNPTSRDRVDRRSNEEIMRDYMEHESGCNRIIKPRRF